MPISIELEDPTQQYIEYYSQMKPPGALDTGIVDVSGNLEIINFPEPFPPPTSINPSQMNMAPPNPLILPNPLLLMPMPIF